MDIHLYFLFSYDCDEFTRKFFQANFPDVGEITPVQVKQEPPKPVQQVSPVQVQRYSITCNGLGHLEIHL